MHECTIGIYCHYETAYMVTLEELKEKIKMVHEFNKRCEFAGFIGEQYTEYSLTDYADRRKSTNLTRFEYCPYCGKKIDWKGIRNNGHN